MNRARIYAALAAADTFLTAICIGRVPPCFTPKDEHVALGINAAMHVMRWFKNGPRTVFGPGSKITELRELVRAAVEELEADATAKDVPS